MKVAKFFLITLITVMANPDLDARHSSKNTGSIEDHLLENVVRQLNEMRINHEKEKAESERKFQEQKKEIADMKAHFEQEIKELKQAIIPQEKQNIIDHSASRYNSSDLEARVDALEDLVSDLGTALVAVASEVDDLEEETTEHDDQIETIGYTVYLHGEQITTLEQSITLLEDDVNILEASDTSQDTRLTALEQTSSSHEQRIDELETNPGPDTEPIGFHARLTSTMGQRGILLFDDILSNVGNNYDPSSGQFTAARQGIYFFSFYADIDSDSTVEMYIGKTGVAQCWADGDGNGPDTIEQSISCSAFMELDIGDVVYVYVWSSDQQTPFEEAEKCGFTGFMLQSFA